MDKIKIDLKGALRKGIQFTQDEIRVNIAEAFKNDFNLKVMIKQIGSDDFFTSACDFIATIHSETRNAQYSIAEKCAEFDFKQGGRLVYCMFLDN